MKIAIQGIKGSFHSLAAQRLYGGDIDFIYCKTFKEVFETLDHKQAETAVVAIENSLYGSINEVYDLLHKHAFWISAETYELVGLHLLGIPGTKLDAITDVYSQAPALGEASDFLDSTLPKAERREHSDTALAAKEVALWNDPTKAAIAGIAAAQEYGLSVLKENIETDSKNFTRFISLVAKRPRAITANKTSITLRTNDTPGSLHAVLGVFAEQGVNLTKLESRPIIGNAWKYMYYIDCNAGLESKEIKTILRTLPECATHIEVLGSYKAGEIVLV